MMMKISKILKIALVGFCLALVTNVSFAQDTSPTNPPDNPDPSDVPIDGGLSLLIAAGVGYIAKKGYDKQKKQVSVQDK